MGLEKIGQTIGKEIVVWTKTGSKSLLATKPIQEINTCGLKYVPEVKCDVVQTTKKLIKSDTSLFSWTKLKPEFSMTNVNPDSLVLVHRTNYYPHNGQILSTNLATKTSEGTGCARTTIHFALNKSVTEHSFGNSWNAMDYSIIAPFKETVQSMPKSKVIGGIQDDFFFQDVVKLPKGSVIVKYNPKVSSDSFLVSDAFDGIKLIETSNRNLNETTNTIIKKMGYTTYNDALKKFLGASESEMKLLESKTETDVRDFFEAVNKCGGVSKYKEKIEKQLKISIDIFKDMPEYAEIIKNNEEGFNETLKWLKLYEKFSEKFGVFSNTWEDFCIKEGYMNGLHCKTGWFNAEIGICGIDLAEKFNGNSWGKNLKQIIIKILNNSEAMVPEGKSLGYDIKKVVKIVEESDTPKITKERMQKELKLKPMSLKADVKNFDIATIGNNEQSLEITLLSLCNG